MKDPVRERINHIAALAKDAFKDHQIEQQFDNGLWRSWRCRRAKSWAYGFDVVTGPGWIMLRGDLGTMCWERELDMVKWARGAINDLSYFAEKVSAGQTKEYDQECAKAWLAAEIEEAENNAGGDEQRLCELSELLDLDNGEPENEHAWKEQVHTSGVCDGGDWPDWNNYTNRFLWLREALKWFLANMKEPVPA